MHTAHRCLPWDTKLGFMLNKVVEARLRTPPYRLLLGM
jgi:hypothetical protein